VHSREPAANAVLLIRELIPDSGCDCAEAAIEDWMRLRVQRAKVVARWTHE